MIFISSGCNCRVNLSSYISNFQNFNLLTDKIQIRHHLKDNNHNSVSHESQNYSVLPADAVTDPEQVWDVIKNLQH